MSFFERFKNTKTSQDPHAKPLKLVQLEEHDFYELLFDIHQTGIANKENSYDQIKFSGISGYEEIKKYEDDKKKLLINYLIALIYQFNIWTAVASHQYRWDNRWCSEVASGLLINILKQKIDFNAKELVGYLEFFRANNGHSMFHIWPVHHAMIQIEKIAKAGKLTAANCMLVSRMLSWSNINSNTVDARKAKTRLEKIIVLASGNEAALRPFKFDEMDAFGKQITGLLNALNQKDRIGIDRILRCCEKASQSKPTAKFQRETKAFIDEIGIKRFKEITRPFLELASVIKQLLPPEPGRFYPFMQGNNASVIKGLVWCFANFHDSLSLSVVAKVGERAFKKIPGVGPSSAAIGNACMYALAASKGLEGLSHLSRLKLVITQNSAQNLAQKYIEEASIKLGISPEEVEAISAQDFGLVNGMKEVHFQDFRLRIEIERIGKIKQTWIKRDGSEQKSTPFFIKDSKLLLAKLNKLKAESKVLAKMITTNRDRIDRSFVTNRRMEMAFFSKYYLAHGLVGYLAKDLVWFFEKGELNEAAMWMDGKWQNLKGFEVEWIDSVTSVRLWHPSFVAASVVFAWRQKLIDLQIKQPLKQVFREVYLLTEAERKTRTYSNRMAAHIIKQHQFNALTAIRGWKYKMRGAFDAGSMEEGAVKYLPSYDLKIEFWIIELNGENEYTDFGVWNYVSTDQVRFVNGLGESVPLIGVPKVVLSEILRDVDLFVGVCSVGNDPQWNDSGGSIQHRDYWESYSFGDLTEIAKTRKDVLESLVPRLKIRHVAHIDGKFLVVKGKLRTYKIHIGSTNILMEPNDQYLCIVPSRKKDDLADKVFLPFDGDKGLSVIISKAMMLAEDDKIKDFSIISQIST